MLKMNKILSIPMMIWILQIKWAGNACEGLQGEWQRKWGEPSDHDNRFDTFEIEREGKRTRKEEFETIRESKKILKSKKFWVSQIDGMSSNHGYLLEEYNILQESPLLVNPHCAQSLPISNPSEVFPQYKCDGGFSRAQLSC